MIRPKIASFFNASDKILRTDTRYIAKGGFWLVLGQVVAMFSGFFLSLAFANLLSKEAFGTYKFILSVAGVISILSLSDMGTAVTRAVARGFDGSLKKAFVVNLKWSIGVIIFGLGISAYYFINGNHVLSISFLFAAFLVPISLSSSVYTSFLLGKKNFRKITLYGLFRNTFPAASLIITLLVSESVILIMLVYFLSNALSALFLYQRTLSAKDKTNDRVDPELSSYGKHLSIIELIAQLANQIDKILIFHYLGAAPLAIYAFAIAPVEQLQGGKKILSSLILPKISERSFEELQKSGLRKALTLTLYALILAAIFIMIAPYFYKFLFPQYLDSIVYSQVYSLTLLAIFGTVFDSTLVAHKKTKELYTHRTIVSIVKIGLFLVLLPIFGLMGLILTHVIIRSFAGILAYYFVAYPFKSKQNI